MTEFNAKKARTQRNSSPWFNTFDLNNCLVENGWKSPDTYSAFYEEPLCGPAVYLFMVLDREDYQTGLVAYVGMSANLQQRWSGHEVLRDLARLDYWTMRWFKPTSAKLLRSIESTLIQRHNPPWNTIGKPVGEALI